MSGDVAVLKEYVTFIKSKEIEVIRGLWNIILMANKHNIDVDHILDQFSTELSHINSQTGNDIYNQQNMNDQFIGLQFGLAVYYLHRGQHEHGFQHLMYALEQSSLTNDERATLRCMRLFERFREFARTETRYTVYSYDHHNGDCPKSTSS